MVGIRSITRHRRELDVPGAGDQNRLLSKASKHKALLWQLIDFADGVGDGCQAIAWTIRAERSGARATHRWATGSSPSCGACRTPPSMIVDGGCRALDPKR